MLTNSQSILADSTFSKAYFITYLNSSFFIVALIPIGLKRLHDRLRSGSRQTGWANDIRNEVSDDDGALRLPSEDQTFLDTESNPWTSEEVTCSTTQTSVAYDASKPLTFRETTTLACKVSLVWFVANFFTVACLEYTTVSSAVILTSTSSIFTLLFGALTKVEIFTYKKLWGVVASLVGVILISSVDISGKDADDRGSFPFKTPGEIAAGDAMAIFSAVLYGGYAIGLTKSIGDESRVNMPLFFGLLGCSNLVFLWPGFFVMHWTGIERFEMPPTRHVWMVLLLNASFSVVSDMCWAWAMLLTSPLVVTVGLSLTIPLSLVGQMVIDGNYASPLYWLGACVVVSSFAFISHESETHIELVEPLGRESGPAPLESRCQS